MKNLIEIKTEAKTLLKNITNKCFYAVECDTEDSLLFDNIYRAYQNYKYKILSIGCDDQLFDNIVSLEIVELDDNDNIVWTHYLNSFEI